jgi:hypothetical protein
MVIRDAQYPVVTVSGDRYLEVRLKGVNKGECLLGIMERLSQTPSVGPPDFAICIGNDDHDECKSMRPPRPAPSALRRSNRVGSARQRQRVGSPRLEVTCCCLGGCFNATHTSHTHSACCQTCIPPCTRWTAPEPSQRQKAGTTVSAIRPDRCVQPKCGLLLLVAAALGSMVLLT